MYKAKDYIQQLADYIETQLNAQSPNGAPNYVYTVSAIGYSNVLQIVNTAGGANNFRIYGATSEQKFGFSTLTAYATTQTGDKKLRLNPPLVMIMRFSNIGGGSKKVMTALSGLTGHFSIPMVGDSYNIVDFQKGSMYNNPIPISKNTTISLHHSK